MDGLISDDDLVRARKDPAFRRRMMAENLDMLLDALNRMRRSSNSSEDSARQIREGVHLAVQLADRLQQSGGARVRVV